MRRADRGGAATPKKQSTYTRGSIGPYGFSSRAARLSLLRGSSGARVDAGDDEQTAATSLVAYKQVDATYRQAKAVCGDAKRATSDYKRALADAERAFASRLAAADSEIRSLEDKASMLEDLIEVQRETIRKLERERTDGK